MKQPDYNPDREEKAKKCICYVNGMHLVDLCNECPRCSTPSVNQPEKKAMNDLLPHVHGDEGDGSTHYACPEQMAKFGEEVHCCGCSGHECDPPVNQSEASQTTSELANSDDWHVSGSCDCENDEDCIKNLIHQTRAETAREIKEMVYSIVDQLEDMGEDSKIIVNSIIGYLGAATEPEEKWWLSYPRRRNGG